MKMVSTKTIVLEKLSDKINFENGSKSSCFASPAPDERFIIGRGIITEKL